MKTDDVNNTKHIRKVLQLLLLLVLDVRLRVLCGIA